ncbi:MAG TPA: ABC transporter substrate-binding protein [Candidatus Dormibacteraeota bacterium]|nr:ABC transporter substrate-binding protein [Candidatus Dormibacteraeota bacterium]
MKRSEALVAGAGLLAGAALPSLPASAAEPILLGWVGPLSPPGGYAAGQEMKWAAQLATNEVNARGGVLGRQLQVFYEDTKGTPDQGTAAMERLATRHVSAVFGEFHSSVALAETKVAHKYGIPFLGTDVWADQITAQGLPEVFRVCPANSLIYTMVGNWAAAAGFKNVAIMQEATDYGVGAVQVLTGIFKKHGINANVVTVEMNQQDFTPEILRLMNQPQRPDIFMIIVAGNSLYDIVRQACNSNFAPTAQTAIYSGGGPALEKELWENDGKCAVDLIAEDVALPKTQWNAKAKAFVAAFEKQFKRPPTGTAMESYDCVGVLTAAIADAKSTNGKAIIAAMERLKYTGARGTYAFSSSHAPTWAYHQYMDAPIMLVQYSKENQTPDDAPILFPRKWATLKELYIKRPS